MKLPVPGDNLERSWARGCPARWSCSSLASTDVGLRPIAGYALSSDG